MAQTSAKYKDQPQTPMERALFWIEYVLRHTDVNDLSLPSRDMNMFQSSNIDVITTITVIIGLVLYVIITCIRKICRCSKQKKIKVH